MGFEKYNIKAHFNQFMDFNEFPVYNLCVLIYNESIKRLEEKMKSEEALGKMNRAFDAFTLLELLIVLTIIGILMAIGMAGIPKLIGTANKKAVESEMASFKVAMMNYKIDNGTEPVAVDELLSRGYITQELALDPWGNQYMLRKNETTGAMEIVSAGEDKKFGTADDIVREIQL